MTTILRVLWVYWNPSFESRLRSPDLEEEQKKIVIDEGDKKFKTLNSALNFLEIKVGAR